MNYSQLPYWVSRLLSAIIKEEYLEEILGDLRELYTLTKQEKSIFYSHLWLIIQTVMLLKPLLIKPLYSNQNIHFTMVKTHFKIGLRSLWKFKGYSFINLFGLTFGGAAAIILFLTAKFENSYDKYLPQHDQIYRVAETHPEIGDYYQTRTPMSPAFKEAYPEVIAATRFFNHGGWFTFDNKSIQSDVFLVDEDFPEIFQFQILAGNIQSVVTDKGKIALTSSHARKLFGYDSPIGKVITKFPEKTNFTVSAIITDPPVNSSLQFDGILGWKNSPDFLKPDRAGNWYNTFMEAYVKLEKGANPQALIAKTEPFIKKNFLPNDELSTIILIPLTEWHKRVSENSKFINLLMVIAFTILIIAGFNFINLNTAQLLMRVKEVGIRKVLGSGRNQILMQFICESMLIVVMAMVLAFLLARISFPVVKEIFDIDLYNVWLINYSVFSIILILTFVYGVLTSLLPALLISKLPIKESIKGAIKKGSSKYLMQKGLIIAQFTASIFLISGTYIIWQQIEYMKKYDLNFDNQNTFSVYSYHGNFKGEDQIERKLLNIKQRLNNHSQVASASFSTAIPGEYWDDFNAYVDATEPEKIIRMRQLTVDPEYFKTLNIEFVSGGNVREKNLSGNKGGYAVLNEAAMQAFGWQTTEGKHLREDTSTDDIQILGVTKDFHYLGLNQSIEPMIHWIKDSLSHNVLTVRVHAEAGQKANPSEVITLLKNEWNQLSTFEPFEYFSLDKSFNNQYQQQERLGYLSGFFSLVAFVIATFGLISLSAFMIRKRKKEIGIRKVLGASVCQLVALLSKSFLILILIAMVISIPLVIRSANEFLSEFAYKVEIGWQLFVLVALFTIITAIISISFQAVKTSLSNPVNEIKDE